MNIDSLRYFYYVAQAGSISVVAKNNHISQSALSQQLFKLEEKLDVKLFIRSNKGVSLTPEGTIVLKHCESIFSASDNIEKELDALKKHKNILTIKSPEVLSSTIISLSLASIRKRYSKLTINLFNYHSILDKTSTILDEDIVISYIEKGYTNDFISELLFEDEFILMTNDSSIKEELSIKDIVSTPFIAVEDTLSAHKHLIDKLSIVLPKFKKLNIVLTTQSYYPAISSCESLNAVIVVPKSAFISKYKCDGFREVKVPELTISASLYISYGDSLYKNEKRFISAFKKSILDHLIETT